jgi:histidinol-phosphate phosphatase family protein
VNERIRSELRARGADLDGIYVCPHAPDAGCSCRKPEPGLVQGALAERGYDPAASFMTGDEERDLEAGRRAGVASLRYDGDWTALARAVLATSARRTAPGPRAATLRGAPGGA